MIRVKINGVEEEVAVATITELLAERGIDPKARFLAVAVNGMVVRRAEWSVAALMAGDAVEENFNIIGRTFSAASTLCCTPNSLVQNGPALGAVAPEASLREIAQGAGFKEFRRATQTPFNRIFEARK